MPRSARKICLLSGGREGVCRVLSKEVIATNQPLRMALFWQAVVVSGSLLVPTADYVTLDPDPEQLTKLSLTPK